MSNIPPPGEGGAVFGSLPISEGGGIAKTVLGVLPNLVPTSSEILIQKLSQPGERVSPGPFPPVLLGQAVIQVAIAARKAVE